MTTTPVVRVAVAADVDRLTELINAAYIVERFFKHGDRTDVAEINALMARGAFLVAEIGGGNIAASVYVDVRGDRGYFGLLAVDPAAQGRGLARAMIEAAESHCRANSCRVMDLRVVNLRTELPPFYKKFGYVEDGTEPADDPAMSRPCHFIKMTKPL